MRRGRKSGRQIRSQGTTGVDSECIALVANGWEFGVRIEARWQWNTLLQVGVDEEVERETGNQRDRY
jgi:hypothetical protein